MEWPGALASKSQSTKIKSISELDLAITKCRKCPRLVEWREEVARTKRKSYQDQVYWGKPVPGFGDSKPKLLDRKSTRLNSSHIPLSRMPSSA